VEAHIEFGIGTSAQYAGAQHENDDYAHTPQEASQKFGRPTSRTHRLDGSRRRTRKGEPYELGYKNERGQGHFLYGHDTVRNRPSAEEATREARNDLIRRRFFDVVHDVIGGRLR
jgi:hypothetical protein